MHALEILLEVKQQFSRTLVRVVWLAYVLSLTHQVTKTFIDTANSIR